MKFKPILTILIFEPQWTAVNQQNISNILLEYYRLFDDYIEKSFRKSLYATGTGVEKKVS